MGKCEGVMMKKIKLILFIPFVLLLVACGNLKHGRVVNKRIFYPPPTYVKSGNVMIPITYPMRFIVTIEGKYKGKIVQKDIDVSGSEYEQIKIGQELKVND